MTARQLAKVIALPPWEAIDFCTGPAREYFYAEALHDVATLHSGGVPAVQTVQFETSGGVVRVFHPPKRFAATMASVRQEIGDPLWDSGRLASFSIDGRSIDEYVQPLTGPHGLRGWAVVRIQGVIVIASSGLAPHVTHATRARRIEVLGRCSMMDGSELQLHGTPGLWRVPKGVIGAMSPPRDATLMPSAVRSAWVDTLGTFVPSGALEHDSGIPAREASDPVTRGVPDEVVATVRHQLDSADADDVERAAAVAFGLLLERGDVAATAFATPPDRARLEGAVAEALRLLSLDDPPPSHD